MVDVEKEREALAAAIAVFTWKEKDLRSMRRMPDQIARADELAGHIKALNAMLARAESSPQGAEAEFGAAGMVRVPIEPPTELLNSMAMRHRHDFGLMSADHQEFYRTEMRKLYEEVVGKGFYHKEWKLSQFDDAALSNNQAEVGHG